MKCKSQHQRTVPRQPRRQKAPPLSPSNRQTLTTGFTSRETRLRETRLPSPGSVQGTGSHGAPSPETGTRPLDYILRQCANSLESDRVHLSEPHQQNKEGDSGGKQDPCDCHFLGGCPSPLSAHSCVCAAESAAGSVSPPVKWISLVEKSRVSLPPCLTLGPFLSLCLCPLLALTPWWALAFCRDKVTVQHCPSRGGQC